jgi:riboflavin kinase/FMN adenylyltransferase
VQQPIAVTIGNFDGVHLGHAALVRAARQKVGSGGRVIVLSFDPHPATLLRPNAPVERLSRFDQRTRWLQEAGADAVVALIPTTELLSQSPEEFIGAIVRRFSPRAIVEGNDFHFGRGRAGSVETLQSLGEAHRFEAVIIEPVETALTDQSMARVSSSTIRWLLSRGRVRDAAMMLGRPYELLSAVARGDRRGRTLGFPTANLAPQECVLPADGIYSGAAIVPGGETVPAAISVGTKPTFGQHARVCEAHLVDYTAPLDHYGWPIRLQFHDWLRDQVRFAGADALVDQLRRDVAEVQAAAAAGASA